MSALLQIVSEKGKGVELTRILCILRTNIIVTSIKNILIHQRRPRRNLPKEANLNRLPNLNPLSLLHKNLAGILAPIFAIERRDTVLLGMVTFFERLKSGHEVVPTGDTVGDDALGDTCCDGAFDDGGDTVHRTDDFGLELWRDVEFDLLEEVF
jgi:hypothetical protein